MKLWFSLVKWLPIGIGVYFIIFFLISSEAILCILAIVVTLSYALIINSHFKKKKRNSEAQKTNFFTTDTYTWRSRKTPGVYKKSTLNINWQDWKKIDVFNNKIEWQNELAGQVIDLCDKIVRNLGVSDSDFHSRKLYRNNTICISIDTDQEYCSDRMIAHLLPSKTIVLDVIQINICTFRVGTWIDCIKALEPEVETALQVEKERSRQNEMNAHISNFGRVD